MIGFLDALGKKLADQWVTLLVLPGMLWVGTGFTAVRLGHRHALDPAALTAGLDDWTRRHDSLGNLAPLLAGVLLAAAASGLTAAWLGALVRRLWLLRGRWWPARLITEWRQQRWLAIDQKAQVMVIEAIRTSAPAAETVHSGPALAETLARRDKISLVLPDRPTWMSDRWHACSVRLQRTYGLDLTVVWPRLWTVLPESARADIATAQTAVSSAGSLTGWAVLYGVLGVWWWPALLVGVVTLATSVLRARTATATLCLLVESAADLYGATLAEQLRFSCPDQLTQTIGRQISTLLRKDPADHVPAG